MLKNKCKIIILLLCVILLLSGCVSYETTSHKSTQYVYEDVQVKIIDIQKSHWFASAHHYCVIVEVYYEENDMTETLEYRDGSIFYHEDDLWNCEVGDYITVTLITVIENNKVINIFISE